MRLPWTSFFLALVAAGCARAPAVDGTKPFQGHWHAVQEGKKLGKEVIFDKDSVLFIEMTTKGKEVNMVGSARTSFRVDNSKSPAHIDFVQLEGDRLGQTKEGIFSFEGDKLKLCIADFESPRPAAFASAEKTVFLVLERKP